MKITSEKQVPQAGTLNVFSLGAISLTWGHMLSLISLWFLPLTFLMYVIGYGSELKNITKK
jgi:hypothetical protein|tara:strand:+ start:3692 stop:3874 length:183 start_codon:yes stop_codon:yes gene_type:complete